jgi:pre-rRNA-processing protein TSR4
MAPYDSDSSGAEDEDFTETNVLLGYASADANGEEISRLGGRPVCLSCPLPTSMPRLRIVADSSPGLARSKHAALSCPRPV